MQFSCCWGRLQRHTLCHTLCMHAYIRMRARATAHVLDWACSDYASIGEPLLKIPEDSSHDVTLNMDAVKYVGPSASFVTRGYPTPGNLGIPGPTIRITPGKHLKLTLNNKLGSNGNAPSTMNEFRDPNTTNIHTHGLHVSSAVDDVFVEVC